MKKLTSILCAVVLASGLVCNAQDYVPTPEIIQAQKEFNDARFGIFIHWGFYSMFGQGEWYLERGNLNVDEYSKAAEGFYPAGFNAEEWAKAFKDAGAKYVTFTTRHHDGFSMFGTKQRDFNIVDGTPFKRDILKELSEALQKEGLKLNLYYSHVDWTHPNYPAGMTGKNNGRDSTKADYNKYYEFMNNQITELLTNYGPIGAMWFDGIFDHRKDSIPFNWRFDEQYALVHKLQPSCLIANNHHREPMPGENLQIFERDLPGQNSAGLSKGQTISHLPLETCNTMNGSWGYKVFDLNYKSVEEIVRYIIKASGMGANLLLNIGPQPNGKLPDAALERLKGIGKWMRQYGETIYGTEAGDFPAQEWGTSTRKGEKLYVHVFESADGEIKLPTGRKVKKAVAFDSRKPVKFSRDKKEGTTTLLLGLVAPTTDTIIELITE